MSQKLAKEATQAWVHLHRAHRLLLERVEKALKDQGLPPLDWYDVLLELHREKGRGLRQYEISEKVLLNKHNLSRLIDRLEKRGLVGRYACEEDGRGTLIIITDEGSETLKRMWPVYSQSIQDNFGDKMGIGEFVELSRVLGKVLASP